MKKLVVLMVIFASLAVVPLGLADSSVLSGYGGSGSKPVVAVAGTSASYTNTTGAKPQTSGAGSLPFTGMDLAIIVAVGIGLVTIGVGLRRLGRDEI